MSKIIGKPVSECKFCARIKNGLCVAISDPLGMWKNGGCLSYTLDSTALDKAEKSISEYNEAKKPQMSAR